VIGSQAILGSYERPPEELLHSLEVDIWPLRDPGGADLIDGALGDGSQFHVAFGYYAHGVGPETAKAPAGWRERLVKRDVPPRAGAERTIVAWCLEVHDLVLSKCAAGRERDWDYAGGAACTDRRPGRAARPRRGSAGRRRGDRPRRDDAARDPRRGLKTGTKRVPNK